MFNFLTKSSDVPEQIYGTLVAQARNPSIFTAFSLPDTVMGRFEVLSLHVFLFSRRMKQQDEGIAISLSQDVFDLFVADVERALRELGIGDTSVPKKKKKMIRSFYGQIDDFDALLDAGNTSEISEKLVDRFECEDPNKARQFAVYIQDTSKKLNEIDFGSFKNGKFSWPAIDEVGV
ncbi:MAG: ubiquinol-cytochrome C chaperone family protein [Pseudomonadota bacterium]